MRKGKSGGFSLIELLAVIAVISVLVAILSPSLIRVRELTRISVCASNHHQMVASTLTYASANEGVFPDTHRKGIGASGDDHVSWTSPAVYKYYERTDIDMLTFACPNRGDNYVKLASGRYRMGYYLMFGRRPELTTGDGAQLPWQSPISLSETGDKVMTGDIIEKGTYNTQWGRFITSSSHGRRGMVHGAPSGYEEPEDIGSMGGNVGMVDGSVHWKPQAEMGEYSVCLNHTISGYW